MPLLLSTADKDFSDSFSSFLLRRREQEAAVDDVVINIMARVREEGDSALIDLTKTYDHHDLDVTGLVLSDELIEAAIAQVPDDARQALTLAARRIRDYHRHQIPKDLSFTDEEGAHLGWQWRPLQRVGLYVPGGQAAYPSSVLMNALPARIAGVKHLAMVVPTPQGHLSPLVVLAARLAGVETIHPIGGAQAIAALAYGTDSIRAVDKIVGPGNAWVAAAKRHVFGEVGIDMIAGPSEVVIYAEPGCRADWLAMDILAQAEHDERAQSILISPDQSLLQKVSEEVDRALRSLPRAAIAQASWHDYGALIQVASHKEAIDLINRLAPEHLQLVTDKARAMVPELMAVGAVFIGALTPEAVGDYVAGSNHVLPTGRTARFSSGLNVLDFMTRFSVIEMTDKSLQAIGPSGAIIADYEGLDAHARSLRLRLQ